MGQGFNEDRYSALALNDADATRRRSIARLVLRHLDPHAYPNTILDVGCASGQLTREIREAVGTLPNIIALDAVQACVDSMRQSGVVNGAHRVTLGEDPIPLPDGSVDLVHASEIIEHVFRTEDMLRDLLRVTRPGGYLILTTPNLASWVSRILLAVFGEQPLLCETGIEEGSQARRLVKSGGPPAGHIRAFTASSLKRMLKHTGWEFDTLQGQSLFSNRWRPLDSLISRLIPCLAGDLIVTARKPRPG